MNMKDMIQRMTDLENGAKQQLNESAVAECGTMPTMPPANPGSPVSMNISLNASGKEHVEDLINMMKNAGMSGAQEVMPAMMPMRMDMERLRDVVDGPKALPMPEEEMEEGKFKDQVIELQDALHNFAEEIQKGMHTYDDVIDELNGMFDDVKASEDKALMNAFKTLRTLEPEDFGEGEGGGPNRASSVAQDAMDMIDGDDDSDYPHLEGYANEPDEQYDDHETMIRDLSGGINREKKMYKKAADGDSDMAVESIKDQLYAMLSEKKKPDADDDGVPDWADKKPGQDDHAGKKKGSKPKKGQVPPQFKKKTNEAEVQAPSHEISDTARKATQIAQMIKKKINSGDQMDDRDYNQMAELGTILSRLGTSFGPKTMKDVLNHMIEYTEDRNQEGHNYPEFNVDRFKELIAMAKD